MSVYLVTGPLPYRDHLPEEKFEAELDPEAEARATKRGHIKLLHSSRTRLRPGSYRLPDGWLTDAHEAPQGAFSLKGAQPDG